MKVFAHRRNTATAILFLLPAFALLLIFKLYPIINTFFLSFSNVNFLTGEKNWIGFDNFQYLFTNKIFWRALRNTITFSISIPILHTVFALLFALIAIQEQKGSKIFRLFVFLPIVMSDVVMAVIWQLILAGESHGLLNSILLQLGLSKQPFLTSPRQALPSLMLIPLWGGTGYWMMIMIAGLQGIPGSIYESCDIDGAGPFRKLFRITIPLLMRTISYILISDTILSSLYFAPVYMITNGGPQNSTTLLAYETYKSGFVHWDLGMAAAYSTIILLLILITVLVQLRYVRARFSYD